MKSRTNFGTTGHEEGASSRAVPVEPIGAVGDANTASATNSCGLVPDELDQFTDAEVGLEPSEQAGPGPSRHVPAVHQGVADRVVRALGADDDLIAFSSESLPRTRSGVGSGSRKENASNKR